jgi:hypothetical protein
MPAGSVELAHAHRRTALAAVALAYPRERPPGAADQQSRRVQLLPVQGTLASVPRRRGDTLLQGLTLAILAHAAGCAVWERLRRLCGAGAVEGSLSPETHILHRVLPALEREVKVYLDENRAAPRVTSISQVCDTLLAEQPTHTGGHTCLSSSYSSAYNLRCERSYVCLAGPISGAQAFGPRRHRA